MEGRIAVAACHVSTQAMSNLGQVFASSDIYMVAATNNSAFPPGGFNESHKVE